MNGFKNTSRMKSGHSFPAANGFTGSAGMRQVAGYTRKPPKAKAKKFAVGGYAKGGEIGNALVQRKDPVTELDRARGGTYPVAAGFARGGRKTAKPFSKKPLIGC